MTQLSPFALDDPEAAKVLRSTASEFRFPWGDDEEDAIAYLVQPALHAPLFIQHQYGDVCCNQAYFRGSLVPLPSFLGKDLDDLMSDMAPDKDRINHILADYQMECEEVIGQGLIRLTNGEFILTQGND